MKYKNYEFVEGNDCENEISISVQIKEDTDMHDYIDQVMESMPESILKETKLYPEDVTDNEVLFRSPKFSFDLSGIGRLLMAHAVIDNMKNNHDIAIDVLANDWVFKDDEGNSYNNERIPVKEFLNSIEI